MPCYVVSPYREDRDKARGRFDKGEFVEVHVSTSLQTCEERDPKDLYKKVRSSVRVLSRIICAVCETVRSCYHPLHLSLVVNALVVVVVAVVMASLCSHV